MRRIIILALLFCAVAITTIFAGTSAPPGFKKTSGVIRERPIDETWLPRADETDSAGLVWVTNWLLMEGFEVDTTAPRLRQLISNHAVVGGTDSSLVAQYGHVDDTADAVRNLIFWDTSGAEDNLSYVCSTAAYTNDTLLQLSRGANATLISAGKRDSIEFSDPLAVTGGVFGQTFGGKLNDYTTFSATGAGATYIGGNQTANYGIYFMNNSTTEFYMVDDSLVGQGGGKVLKGFSVIQGFYDTVAVNDSIEDRIFNAGAYGVPAVDPAAAFYQLRYESGGDSLAWIWPYCRPGFDPDSSAYISVPAAPAEDFEFFFQAIFPDFAADGWWVRASGPIAIFDNDSIKIGPFLQILKTDTTKSVTLRNDSIIGHGNNYLGDFGLVEADSGVVDDMWKADATEADSQFVTKAYADGLGGTGEVNTFADTGTFDDTDGFGLAGGKTVTALKVKGLIEGTGITIAKSGDSALTVTLGPVDISISWRLPNNSLAAFGRTALTIMCPKISPGLLVAISKPAASAAS